MKKKESKDFAGNASGWAERPKGENREPEIKTDILTIRESEDPKRLKTTQEEIEDKILKEILVAESFEKRYKLIQQLELLSRALITIKERVRVRNF